METLNKVLEICRILDDKEPVGNEDKIKRQARYEFIRALIDAEVI